MTTTDNPIVTVRVALYQSDIDSLKSLIALSEMSKNNTQALRTAIATALFVYEAQAQGEKILLEAADGTVRQMILK